jgi:nicotinamide-nucleotide amidase
MSIQHILADTLTKRGLKLAVAESCTGGLISCKLTDLPGSSAFLERGFVTYSNLAKIELLSVPDEIIAAHGAVSREVAELMAKGALRNSDADIAVAVTGIAGPTGGTEKKPVGTVFIAVATKDNVRLEKFNFSGDRLEIKEKTSVAALNMLHEELKRA